MEEDDKIKITKYSYISENNELKEYFIGAEIAKLLGYKNNTQAIQLNVSEENKQTFKNYLGVKEPKINSKQILINKNGINELINKNRKTISEYIINTLKDINIVITANDYIKDANVNKDNDKKKEDCGDGEEEEDGEESIIKDDLSTYSYISNGLYFEYFVGYEITTLLGYKNPHEIIKNNVSKSNQIFFNDYPGVKKPKLQHNTILISRDGAIEVLIKTRKRISPDVLHILKKFGIETTNRKCLTKEQQTLSTITDVFKTEKFEDQYKVDIYYLDLYFTEYKIVCECDERGHFFRKQWKERERMDFVNETLGIDDLNWIRFNPDEPDFDVSKVIGRIYRKMDEIKQQKYNKALEEEKRKVLEEEKGKEGKSKNLFTPECKLQIEPITCKFTAPPKEYLLEKLKTHNITEIAKSYGISTNPVSKWLKQYEINIEEFHNVNAPPKEELIEQCRDKTQTEVGLHYNVSNHIVRKWLKGYELDFKKVKSGVKQITKDELVKLMGEFDEKEVAKRLNITRLNLEKLLMTHSIEKIPKKADLEKMLHEKSKDDLAKYYATTRTTLRKWIKSYGLEKIRYENYVGRKMSAIKEDNTILSYPSMNELCKALHVSKRKVYEIVDTDTFYNGYKFQFDI